ncbi:cyclopropane-fatty-acyl-phospholipid synthase-like [Folsomia candida]|uniref:cyclopropane-fatty-acyl-phospholipid synthase-like n=1 Tax=Folsomia candida TaxID=158441 RepID=UPI001605522B|nr:cyclopropane-fatty-acyl-phospholipid synthase-like [Folsomia candida]
MILINQNMILYKGIKFIIKLYRKLELFFLTLFPNLVEKYVQYHFGRSGVEFNGIRRWDIQVKDKSLYPRIVNHGPLGLGEGYMDGQWECEDISAMAFNLFHGDALAVVNWFHPWNRFLNYMSCSYFNLQSQSRSWEVGEKHYDLGDDLFESFMDSSMNYTCGYWKNASTLAEAQYNKMELVASKLNLKPGMRILDMGCGWGGLCHHLAKNYHVSVVGITISRDQVVAARKRCANLPVEIRLIDYRDLLTNNKDEQFDRIVSIGMLEHVGKNNHKTFFNTVHKCLTRDGIFFLHSIGIDNYHTPCSEPWLTTYIFPNGYVPYHKEIIEGIENLFVLEDWQNFGNDYTKTLEAWWTNFELNWPKIKDKYGERFFRMWKYFFQFHTGAFKSRKGHVWQIVLSKEGILGGYYAGR